jgi:hypothetical protein
MAQLVHAAGTYAVVLQVGSEAELLDVARRLADRGIAFRLIVENDPPYTDQATAIGVEPRYSRSDLKPVLGNLRTYGSKNTQR